MAGAIAIVGMVREGGELSPRLRGVGQKTLQSPCFQGIFKAPEPLNAPPKQQIYTYDSGINPVFGGCAPKTLAGA